MADGTELKYRAFISYSHTDTARAQWLHRALERFPLRGLAGRETALGPVPKTLHPIFRDRNDFSAGGTLTDLTIAALDDSAALIVLCSAASAKSAAVNEEIRLFRWRHPSRPVIPIIASGLPGGAYDECFAPALKFAVNAGGAITDEPQTLLGADLRNTGDGEDLALAKVVATLIGVPSDEVYRRAERDRRRTARIRTAMAAGFVALAGTGIFFWIRSETLMKVNINAAEKCKSRLPQGQSSLPLNVYDACVKVMEAYEEGSVLDPRDAKIAQLINDGQWDEAEKQQIEKAQAAKARGKKFYKKAAEEYQRIATTAGYNNPEKAYSNYAEAARLDPDNPDAVLWYGSMAHALGRFDEAKSAFEAVIKNGKKDTDNNILYWAYLGTGDVEFFNMDSNAALQYYRQASAIGEKRELDGKNNVNLKIDMIYLYLKIGNVLLDVGETNKAFEIFQAGYNSSLDSLKLTKQENIFESVGRAAEAHVLTSAALGRFYISNKEYAKAHRYLLQARDILSEFGKINNNHETRSSYLSSVLAMISVVDLNEGDLTGAEKTALEALDILQKKQTDANIMGDLSIAEIYKHLSKVYAIIANEDKDLDPTRGSAKKMLEYREKWHQELVKANDRQPSSIQIKIALAESYADWGFMFNKLAGDAQGAWSHYLEALTNYDYVSQKNNSPKWKFKKAEVSQKMAQLAESVNQSALAYEKYRSCESFMGSIEDSSMSEDWKAIKDVCKKGSQRLKNKR